MSSDVKNKLLNLEATPPTQVWQVIAAELDDSGIGHPFSKKLKEAAVTPPPQILSKIFSALDKQETAPAYAASLYQMEVPPPSGTWYRIKKNLDINEEAAIPEYRRFSPFIKYAAAAVIIGLLFLGGLQLYNNNKGDSTAVATTTNRKAVINTADKNPSTSSINFDAATAAAEATEEARSEAALEASKKVYASVNVSALKKKLSKKQEYFIEPEPSATYQTRGLGEMYETADDQLATPDKYIVLMTPDGKIIRMSKNLSSDMVCCASGEEQDKDCIDQMSKWRKQIANHPKTLSPGNFLDIIGLVNSLQED